MNESSLIQLQSVANKLVHRVSLSIYTYKERLIESDNSLIESERSRMQLERSLIQLESSPNQ